MGGVDSGLSGHRNGHADVRTLECLDLENGRRKRDRRQVVLAEELCNGEASTEVVAAPLFAASVWIPQFAHIGHTSSIGPVGEAVRSSVWVERTEFAFRSLRPGPFRGR